MMSPSPESSINPRTQLPPAELAGGRYVIMGSLGAGSQGETLDAVDKREGRPVAVKRFTIRGAKSWKDVELAEREAAVLSSLRHPALPRYIEHFEENGALYLVMEKIEGETLAERRKRGVGLDQQQLVRFLKEAGECLRYLHSQAPPVVHRDIKPGNVILRPDGSYCLVDFGSVRDRLKPEGGSTVVGTFGFMAPEQFQGRATPGSDVYAVAATALSLLTGSEPENLPHKGLAIDVEGALRGSADSRLIAALRHMLEPDPDRRAGSVDAALRRAGLHGAPLPRPGESSAQAAKRARRARLSVEDWLDAASRLGDDRADSWHGHKAERHQHQAERHARKAAREAERFARKAARKAERYARRSARQQWRRAGRPVPPAMVLGVLLLLAFRVASIATFALFQVLLPTLFALLGVFGGPRMHRRGRRMIQIGEAGQAGLQRAREHIRHQFLGGADPGEYAEAPSPPPRAPRQRVAADEDPAGDIEAELEELEAELDPRRGERRR